jgi:hypothetical protein
MIPKFNTTFHTKLFCAKIIPLCFLLYLSSSTWNFAQNSKQFNGKIIDQQTKAAIPFAHVGIPKLGTGVVSNEEGYFTFYYPQSARDDTLLVSFLGYKTARISLKKYAAQTQNDTLKIALSPDVIGLQEVVISNNSDSAKAILKRALARLKKNYPTTVFQMNAFFREKVQNQDDNRFTQLLEGMIDIRDWGIKSHPDKIRVRLNEFRKSEDLAKRNFFASHWRKMVGEQNDFYDILIHDPVRIHLSNKIEKSTVGGITAYGGQYRYELELIFLIPSASIRIVDITSYDGEPVFNLKFNYYHTAGNIFVNCNDYGIHHIEMWVSFDLGMERLPEHLRARAKDNVKETHFEGKYMGKINIDYRKINSKYYLSFINWLDLGDFRKSNLDPGKRTASYRTCTLMVNSIQTNKKEMDKVKLKKTVNRDENITQTKAQYNADFWKNYNVLLASPIEAKVIRDLSVKESLEEQFKKN